MKKMLHSKLTVKVIFSFMQQSSRPTSSKVCYIPDQAGTVWCGFTITNPSQMVYHHAFNGILVSQFTHTLTKALAYNTNHICFSTSHKYLVTTA